MHLTAALQADPFIGYRDRCFISVDLFSDALAGIVGSSGRCVVFAERLNGYAVCRPAHRPVHTPDEFSLTFGVVRDTFVSAGTPVGHSVVFRIMGKNGCSGNDSALLTDRIVRGPPLFEFAAGDSLKNPFDLFCMFEGCLDLFGEHAGPIGLTCPDNAGVNVKLLDRGEEWFKEVLGVAFVFSAGAGNI